MKAVAKPGPAEPSAAAPSRSGDASTATQASVRADAEHAKGCACGGRCPRCRAAAARAATTSQGLATQGKPLDSQTRGAMESRLGHRLSDVRIHADGSAAQAARRRGAEAYTEGSRLVFGAGRYAPHSAGGRELLAHELAHVVQQRRANRVEPGGAARRAAGAAESQADAAAGHVVAGRRAALPPLSTVPQVQHQDTHTFGAGIQQVTVQGTEVRVNGTKIPATAQADGSILYRGREIVLDNQGIFRVRETWTIARPCNPEYYDSAGKRRAGVDLPPRNERSGTFYDPRTREHTQRQPPVVQQGRSRPRAAEPAVPRVDDELATRMQEVNRYRTELETRIQVLVDQGVKRNLAERQARLEIESGGRPLPGQGELEAGQTYSGSRGANGEVTITAARQSVAERAFTRVAASRLTTYLTNLNQRLGTNFVVNPQTLNHAEVRQLVLHPERTAFYPDRAMCDSCQRIFVLEAQSRGADVHVIDPDGTARVFTADGRIVEFREGTVYERQTSVRTTGQGEARRTQVEIRHDSQVVHRARPRTPGEPPGGRRPGGPAAGQAPAQTPGQAAPRQPAVTPRRPPAVAPARPPAAGAAPAKPPATTPRRPPPVAAASPPATGASPAKPPAVTPQRPPPVAAARPPSAPPAGAPGSVRPGMATTTPRTPTPATPKVSTPAVPAGAANAGSGARTGGAAARGGKLRGVGTGLALGGALVVAEIAQLIIDLTIVRELQGIVADLQAWQQDQLKQQIQQHLEARRSEIEGMVQALEADIQKLWKEGKTAHLRIRYNVVYADERDSFERRTSAFDSTPKPITDPFDLRFYRVENLRIDVVESAVAGTAGTIKPAMEPSLTSPTLEQQRDTMPGFIRGEPLVEQSVTVGQALEPPVPEKTPDEVAQVTLSCNDMWIAFHTAHGTKQYDLETCGLRQEGTYQAQVTTGTEQAVVDGRPVERPTVGFHLGTADIPKEETFDFRWIVQEGQENPATFFEGQSSVTLRVVHGLVPFRDVSDLAP